LVSPTVVNQTKVMSKTEHCAVKQDKHTFPGAYHEVVSRGLINLAFQTFFLKLNIKFLEYEFFFENLTLQLDHKGKIEGLSNKSFL
jgi:hypothetical protein